MTRNFHKTVNELSH